MESLPRLAKTRCRMTMTPRTAAFQIRYHQRQNDAAKGVGNDDLKRICLFVLLLPLFRFGCSN